MAKHTKTGSSRSATQSRYMVDHKTAVSYILVHSKQLIDAAGTRVLDTYLYYINNNPQANGFAVVLIPEYRTVHHLRRSEAT